MDKLPIELQSMIASYVVEPVYQIAECLRDSIDFEALCSNPHPAAMIMIDDYFERCLTIQSHLEYTMLHRLYHNPLAQSLLKKYEYFMIKYRIKELWTHFTPDNVRLTPTWNIKPWNGYEPSDWIMDADLSDFAGHPRIIELIEIGSIPYKQLRPMFKCALYQNPAIFQINYAATKGVLSQWVINHNKKIENPAAQK